MAQLRDVAKKIYDEDTQIKKTVDKLAGQLNLRLNNSNQDIFAIVVNLIDLSLSREGK